MSVRSFRAFYVGLVCLFALGCGEKSKTNTDAQSDEVSRHVDSLMKDYSVKEATRKIAISDSLDGRMPIKILKSHVANSESGVAEAVILVKNISKKPIDGYKIQFICYNNFGDILGLKSGIDQDVIKPGKTKSATWELYGYRATTKIKSRIYQVHFRDGTIWENESDNTH